MTTMATIDDPMGTIAIDDPMGTIAINDPRGGGIAIAIDLDIVSKNLLFWWVSKKDHLSLELAPTPAEPGTSMMLLSARVPINVGKRGSRIEGFSTIFIVAEKKNTQNGYNGFVVARLEDGSESIEYIDKTTTTTRSFTAEQVLDMKTFRV